MRKIAIIGSPGSGKSTLARELGSSLTLPIYHLDALLWKPNWEMTDRAEQIDIQKDILKEDSWIIDGNYAGTIDLRIQAADTIILLDFSRYRCIYQATKRVFKYRNRIRPDMQKDCPERFDLEFFRFIWNFNKHIKPKVLAKLTSLSEEKKILHFTSKRQLDKWKSENM
ncbi:DNA topology modulation protein [Saliterribacillus persicus]|uniref:Adenylate kinase family enzyme n=1 Tax=Saliterribacillus persicus TaxID=930114 RepID=A0A368YAU0_9BACI|nr:DNA topology modulation protein [Saliterribacillus persicus]RCW77245.1 adenylate kinase family enzyme [Saliterribacillus persicus]